MERIHFSTRLHYVTSLNKNEFWKCVLLVYAAFESNLSTRAQNWTALDRNSPRTEKVIPTSNGLVCLCHNNIFYWLNQFTCTYSQFSCLPHLVHSIQQTSFAMSTNYSQIHWSYHSVNVLIVRALWMVTKRNPLLFSSNLL